MALRKLFSRKVNLNVSGRKLALQLIPLIVVLCCCSCFAFAVIDSSLREIGLLPTYTPEPTRTVTPFPSETPTQVPSSTSAPMETAIPSETPTSTLEPTETPTLVSGAMVVIKFVNKSAEYVDLENIGNQSQDLAGWRIVSERGNQVCWLAGVIQPGETLRVWTNNPNGEGYNCGMGRNIWNDNESDPAALYNAQGVVVSRYP
jgi:hypothetical protein